MERCRMQGNSVLECGSQSFPLKGERWMKREGFFETRAIKEKSQTSRAGRDARLVWLDAKPI